MNKSGFIMILLVFTLILVSCSKGQPDVSNTQPSQVPIASSSRFPNPVSEPIITQRQMNQDAGDKSKQADDTLNNVYNQVRFKYQGDKEFVDKLTDAELAWIAFRDAELDAIYPDRNTPGKYGSVFPMTFALEKTGLTLAREKQLTEWLEGMPASQNAANLGIDYAKLTGTPQKMNKIIADESQRAEGNLNNIYNQILVMYKNNTLFIDKLIDAELAWIAFRDAELEAVNSARNKQTRYGSLYPMAYEIEKTRLTWARVAQLKQWSEGLPEGVVGAGSRRIR